MGKLFDGEPERLGSDSHYCEFQGNDYRKDLAVIIYLGFSPTSQSLLLLIGSFFLSLYYSFMCVNVCTCMCNAHSHACVCAQVDAGGWSQMSSSVASPSYFLRQKCSLTLDHTNSVHLAGEQAPGTLLSLPHQHWGYRCALLCQPCHVGSGQMCVSVPAFSHELWRSKLRSSCLLDKYFTEYLSNF